MPSGSARLMQGPVGGEGHSRGDGGAGWPASPSSSSSGAVVAGGSGSRPGKRLTPDAGSEDEYEDGDDDEEDDDDDEEEKEDEDEEDELRGRVKGRSDEEEARSSDEHPRRPRRRRQLYTAEEEQAVVRKFDRKLVVFVALLYMLSFLDRSNIGNARVAGMDDDLQSVPPREGWYEWALGAFYIAYIIFEWMALLWRIIPAHIYVAALVMSWGVIASLQAVAVNYPMLIFLRFLLGIGEAGFTGVPFYLSFFFKRDELAFRTAMFVSAAPLATSFAASLAWLIVKLAEYSPIAPWRLLFLIEGFPSVLVAAVAYRVIPDSPQTAPYLTTREKKVARLRLQPTTPQTTTPTTTTTTRDTLAVLTDPAAWLTALIFLLTNMAYSSLPVFLPTILTAMGHTPLQAQALSAPPYLTAFLTVLATAYASDATSSRAPFLITHALASATGYAILALADTPLLRLDPGSLLRYLAVYPAAVGFFNVVVLTVTWSINNQRGAARQGAGFALLQVVGQCGPLVGTRLYPDGDAPYYTRGMAVCAGAMVGVAVLAGGLRVWLGRVNARWDREEGVGGGDGEGEGDGEEGEALVGGGVEVEGRGGRERERGFRYML
ncbi:major facilitator superfamily domain-containing protein [Chaetomium tenue]|uniref:Major facilitator superfamily domain-containing protein n=1 Tax=Chaetomium tenue TaxID=1854479 RepID=A0ACB7P5L5_9PEZI|nr:major facilitator superfamily domain-containing protein [Chaetomium globosum]